MPAPARAPGLTLILLVLATLLAVCAARAQPYTVDWYKIAGGGGTGAAGAYQVSGTIGQPEAGGPLRGGPYSVTGGYWGLLSVVPAAGVPPLTILRAGPQTVRVLWPALGSYTLLQTLSLATGGWTTNTAPVTTANGTNSITINPPNGNLFFRLSSP